MDIALPVTLIVKAPNQQIEDQTVKCELSWTIHKLKGHLSEVYPSKPARDEQKLIYSGQLLSDTVILKDILRNYDEQNTHTVHLVCAPSRNYKFEAPKPKPNPDMAQPAPSPPTSTSAGTAELRQRPVAVTHSTQETMTDFQTLMSTLSQLQTNGSDPTQYAMQLAMFQQAYMQYMNQYMQMINQLPTRAVDAQPEPEAAAAAPEPVIGLDAGGAEEQDADEPQADRDWLDWFYVFSRVLVLFCIVYFYSSPLRFAFVLLLGIGLYMYQMGFFRAQAVNNNEIRRPENNNMPAAQTADTANNQANATVIAEQRPTMLNIMWTFFTTFFASLIPEIPNAV